MKGQRDLLVRFCQVVPLAEKFFLTGGTALGVFYLHHRISKDLDLFTTEEIDLVEYAKVLRDVVKPLQIIAERSPTFVSYISAEGIRVDFVVDNLSVKGPRPRVWLEEGVFLTLDVLDNIGANKICSVVSRGEPRDAVDLFFLLKDERELFFRLFEEAQRREALLEDLLYVSSAFEGIAEATEGMLAEMRGTLRKPVNPYEFRHFWLSIAKDLERRLNRWV